MAIFDDIASKLEQGASYVQTGLDFSANESAAACAKAREAVKLGLPGAVQAEKAACQVSDALAPKSTTSALTAKQQMLLRFQGTSGAQVDSGTGSGTTQRIGYFHKSKKKWFVWKLPPKVQTLGASLAGLAEARLPELAGPSTVALDKTAQEMGAAFEGMYNQLPPGVKNGGETDDPVYKKPWFWIGGGLVVVGLTAFFVLR